MLIMLDSTMGAHPVEARAIPYFFANREVYVESKKIEKKCVLWRSEETNTYRYLTVPKTR